MLQLPRLLGLVVALLLSLPAGAQEPATVPSNVYRVSGIEVDVTAADAVAARQDALLQGQREGLARLLRRLVPAEAHDQLPDVDLLQIERYVQNFEITREEVGPTRYIAQMVVRYDPLAVRELLQGAGLPFAETPSAPVVILPLYLGPEGPRLWPDANPWWQAWAENLDPERLLRLVLPLGDLEDMASLTAEQVQAGDPEALTALAARYGSEEVLIISTRPLSTPDPAAAPAVELQMHRVGKLEQTNEPEIIRGQAGQSFEELLAEAVRRLQDSLDERWKSANLLRFDQAGIMVVDIPITQLSDWVTINRGLQNLPEVDQVEIATFARDNVRAQIRYIGDQLRLEEALGRLGLTLSREGGSWLLLRTGESPSQGEPPSTTSSAY